MSALFSTVRLGIPCLPMIFITCACGFRAYWAHTQLSVALVMIKVNRPILSVLFFVFVLAPGAAYALIPLLYGLGLVLGGSPEFVTALGIAGIAHAAIIGWVTFGANNATPTQTAPLRVQINPTEKASVPPGWSASGAGVVQPNPPGTTSPIYLWSYAGGLTGSDPAAVALDTCQNVSGSGSVAVFQVDVNSSSKRYGCLKTGQVVPLSTIIVSKIITCPNGYSSNSTTCVLSAPALAEKPDDDKCDVLRDVTGKLAPDSRDPDCRKDPGLYTGPDGMQYNSPDGKNRARVFKDAAGFTVVTNEVVSSSGARYEFVTLKPVTTGSGVNAVTTYQVDDVGSGSGTVPLSSATAAATGAPGAGGGVTGTGSSGTGTGTGTSGSGLGSTCGGPGQPLCATGGGNPVCGAPPLPPCEIDFGSATTAPSDPGSRSAGEIATALDLPSVNAFKAASYNPGVGTCPKATFNINYKSWQKAYTFDSHCGILDGIGAQLRALLISVGVIVSVFVILRA